jgi:hypothetical protein
MWAIRAQAVALAMVRPKSFARHDDLHYPRKLDLLGASGTDWTGAEMQSFLFTRQIPCGEVQALLDSRCKAGASTQRIVEHCVSLT